MTSALEALLASKLLAIMADVALHPAFAQDELDRVRDQSIDGFSVNGRFNALMAAGYLDTLEQNAFGNFRTVFGCHFGFSGFAEGRNPVDLSLEWGVRRLGAVSEREAGFRREGLFGVSEQRACGIGIIDALPHANVADPLSIVTLRTLIHHG